MRRDKNTLRLHSELMEPRPPQKKAFVSPRTAADIFNVSYSAIISAIHRGDIPAIKIGRVFRVPREAMETIGKMEKVK